MALKKNLLLVITGMTMIVFSSAHLSAHSWMAPSHEAVQGDPRPANQQSIESGQSLFAAFCAQCHGADGQGLPASLTLLGSDTPNLPKRLKNHSEGDFHWKIRTGKGQMPAFEEELSANEIWDIVHFIHSKAK